MSYRKLSGAASLLRIYCGDFDRYEHQPVYRSIIERARKSELAGCTVFSGFWGYGSRRYIHTDITLEGAGEKSILVVIVDKHERIRTFVTEVLPILEKAKGLVAEQPVFVHHYQSTASDFLHGSEPRASQEETRMERSLNGENVLLRIFIDESDKFGHEPLFEAIVKTTKSLGLAGCTVIKAIMGFGANSVIHKGHLFRISQDNPILIEIVESAENVTRLLEEIRPMLQGALITEEKVLVHR